MEGSFQKEFFEIDDTIAVQNRSIEQFDKARLFDPGVGMITATSLPNSQGHVTVAGVLICRTSRDPFNRESIEEYFR
jgi:hypothetical protein